MVWQDIVLRDNYKCFGLELDEEQHNLKATKLVCFYRPVRAKLYPILKKQHYGKTGNK